MGNVLTTNRYVSRFKSDKASKQTKDNISLKQFYAAGQKISIKLLFLNTIHTLPPPFLNADTLQKPSDMISTGLKELTFTCSIAQNQCCATCGKLCMELQKLTQVFKNPCSRFHLYIPRAKEWFSKIHAHNYIKFGTLLCSVLLTGSDFMQNICICSSVTCIPIVSRNGLL